jgi:AsmA protein
VNVAEAVLSGATGIQGLTQLVSTSTRRKYPGLLTSADTDFETLHASFQIADGVATTNDLRLRAPDYEIDGRGDVRLDNRLSFHAVLRASERLTEDIVDEVKVAKYLRSSDRQLEIPFRLKGSWPQVRPKPDEEALLEALGRGALGKGLADLLGVKKKSDGKRVGETPGPTTKDLLRQGLDELFGR